MAISRSAITKVSLIEEKDEIVVSHENAAKYAALRAHVIHGDVAVDSEKYYQRLDGMELDGIGID
jgi:hypothetical protein